MTAKELLEAGQLSTAIEQLNKDVKAHPTDSRLRTFLFELLCFAGDYQRADRQLEIIGHQSAKTEIGVQAYRNILAAEKARQRLFSEGLRPHFLLGPPPYTHYHLEAINRLRENRLSEARALLEESASNRTPCAGQVDGQPFADLQDSDNLLAPFLEVIVHDTYTWLPFAQIKRLQITPPKRLRDLLWTQATLETVNGPAGEVFIPVLYAGSSSHADDQVRLGRMTDWRPLGEGLSQGVGQRLLLIDDEERAILEVREIKFDGKLTVHYMASPQTIDLEALLAPIPGENPSGESLRYEGTYDTIQEQLREDDNLEQGDWKREAKTADWRGCIATASEALAAKSKDLQIATWLTRALVKRHGFAGLRDSLQLLRELQERFWDSLYPELEDGEVEFRAGPLDGLNTSLPVLIRQAALAESGNGETYSWLQWNEARTVDNLARQNQEEALQAALADGKITGEQFNKAVAATPRAFYETLFEDVWQSREECERLDRVSDEKFGRAAPSLVEIKKAIEECHDLISRIRREKREREGIKDDDGVVLAESPNGPESGLSQPSAPSLVTPLRSGNARLEPQDRADALRRLEAVAVFFRRTEPHSPVSYLVQRAARWGQMPLEDWLQEVVKSEDVLSYIRETLGIKGPNSSAGTSETEET
jgi:type VI secretion system ImpA family protein